MSTELTVPGTGELIDVARAPDELLAYAHDAIADVERDLKSDKRRLADELARRLDHEGRRSADAGAFHVEVNAPTERQWNVDELRGVLADLVAEGTISQAKAQACIKFEPKPVWMQLKPLLSDPRCKERIGHALTEAETTRYVKVRRS